MIRVFFVYYEGIFGYYMNKCIELEILIRDINVEMGIMNLMAY